MIERHVNLGDVVAAGQIVAKLDSQNQAKLAALRPGQSRLGAGDADPGAAHFRAPAGAVEGRLDPACQVRRRPASPAHGGSPGRRRPRHSCHIAQDQLGYTVLRADSPGAVTATGAEAGRGREGRADDRAARRHGEARCRFRRPRTAHPDRPARPGRRARAQRRLAGEGHRPRARGGAPGRFRHPHLPGQGRHQQSARSHEARLDGHRPHQARGAGRRRGPGKRAHRRRRPPGRLGGRSPEPRPCRCAPSTSCATTRPAS